MLDSGHYIGGHKDKLDMNINGLQSLAYGGTNN